MNKKNIKIHNKYACLLANVIIDGNIMEENLKKYDKTKTWLEKELKKQNKKAQDIFLATLDKQNNLNLYELTSHKATDVLE